MISIKDLFEQKNIKDQKVITPIEGENLDKQTGNELKPIRGIGGRTPRNTRANVNMNAQNGKGPHGVGRMNQTDNCRGNK